MSCCRDGAFVLMNMLSSLTKHSVQTEIQDQIQPLRASETPFQYFICAPWTVTSCSAPASLRGQDLRSPLRSSNAESWGELRPVYTVGDWALSPQDSFSLVSKLISARFLIDGNKNHLIKLLAKFLGRDVW